MAIRTVEALAARVEAGAVAVRAVFTTIAAADPASCNSNPRARQSAARG